TAKIWGYKMSRKLRESFAGHPSANDTDLIQSSPLPRTIFDQFSTGYKTRVPAGNRFTVSVPFKEFFPAFLLRIFAIKDFEPSAALSLFDVGTEFVLGNHTFQIQFTDPLKERRAGSVNVVGVFQWRMSRHLRQRPLKLLLAIH